MFKHQYHPDHEYLPPDDIQPDGSPVWVFVFPSTFGGQHLTDHVLAKAAYTYYAATLGSAHGRQGRSYAIMTYTTPSPESEPASLTQIQTAVEKFFQYAEHRKQAGEQFWIPNLMLAPITFSQLSSLFRHRQAPSNVSFPESWKYQLEAPADILSDYVVHAYHATTHVVRTGQHTDICL